MNYYAINLKLVGKDARTGKGWFAAIFSPSQKTNNQVRKGVLQQRTKGVIGMNLAMIDQEKVDNNYVMVRA